MPQHGPGEHGDRDAVGDGAEEDDADEDDGDDEALMHHFCVWRAGGLRGVLDTERGEGEERVGLLRWKELEIGWEGKKGVGRYGRVLFFHWGGFFPLGLTRRREDVLVWMK